MASLDSSKAWFLKTVVDYMNSTEKLQQVFDRGEILTLESYWIIRNGSSGILVSLAIGLHSRTKLFENVIR